MEEILIILLIQLKFIHNNFLYDKDQKHIYSINKRYGESPDGF